VHPGNSDERSAPFLKTQKVVPEEENYSPPKHPANQFINKGGVHRKKSQKRSELQVVKKCQGKNKGSVVKIFQKGGIKDRRFTAKARGDGSKHPSHPRFVSVSMQKELRF